MIALVTGASSGIGRDIARELAKRKYNIIAVARNEDALKELKNELEKEYEVNVDVRAMDLIDRDGCRKLHDDVKSQYGIIDVLVNDAGFGTCGKFTETDLDKELGMIDTNVVALHILTKLFLIDMVEADSKYVAKYAVKLMFLNRTLIFPSFFIWMGRLLAKIFPDQISAFVCYFAQRRKIS